MTINDAITGGFACQVITAQHIEMFIFFLYQYCYMLIQ